VSVERGGYGFTPEDKRFVHQRAGQSCEFPGDVCDKRNTGIVNHLTGVAIARLDNKTQESISNPDLNALMLCGLHAFMLDVQEAYEYACLLNERRRIPRVPNMPRARRPIKRHRG
jgi:hypothetical protein